MSISQRGIALHQWVMTVLERQETVARAAARERMISSAVSVNRLGSETENRGRGRGSTFAVNQD